MIRALAARPSAKAPVSPKPLTGAIARRMRAVKQKNTAPELELRTALHRLGLRYRVNASTLPHSRFRADIVFRRGKVAIFVNGCFWHGCATHRTIPRNNFSWWAQKLENTRIRDRRIDSDLKLAGWFPIRVWEHDDFYRAAHAIRAVVIHRRFHGEWLAGSESQPTAPTLEDVASRLEKINAAQNSSQL